MQLLKGIHAVDLTLLLGDTLIISDVHIGFEEALNKQGMMVPRDHFPQLIARMEGIFARLQGRPTNKKKGQKTETDNRQGGPEARVRHHLGAGMAPYAEVPGFSQGPL